ncbi:MAG: polysaccharide pyruvyl transferase family protein [Pseudomonadota bacterium]
MIRPFDWGEGVIPLAWVAGMEGPPPYVNVGDALSPVMVSLVAGRPVRRAPFSSIRTRMTAVGTVGQSIVRGTTAVWGTGCSPWANPLAGADRRPYSPPPRTELQLRATRGPFSARLLSGGDRPALPYGDPAMLLPLFYRPKRQPRYQLGVVIHLSELEDRSFEARPKPQIKRYVVDPGAEDRVRLITMVAPPGSSGLHSKIDELLDCERIVSTSLHGIALALAYGIPCLYLSAARGKPGVVDAPLDATGDGALEDVNARFPDLYAGLGFKRLVYWRQAKRKRTDWAALIAAIDRNCSDESYVPEDLIEVCPPGADPISAPSGETIWNHPLIAGFDHLAKAAA